MHPRTTNKKDVLSDRGCGRDEQSLRATRRAAAPLVKPAWSAVGADASTRAKVDLYNVNNQMIATPQSRKL